MPRKKHILIVHGAYGDPEENWIPWLKAALHEDGHEVIAPVFPTPEGQTWDEWLRIAHQALEGRARKDTILIGHSIGAAFVASLAEMTDKPFKAVFFLSPFFRQLGLPDFDPINATFLQRAFDKAKIRRGAKKIVCIAGGDDPYVPLAIAREAADIAGAKLIVVEKGGHLNAGAGFTEFPLLLEKIRKVG